jgi:hypothetical protein
MKFEGIEIAQFQIPSSAISIPSNFIFFKSLCEGESHKFKLQIYAANKNIDDSLTISGYIRSPRAIEADIVVNTSMASI